MTKLIVCAACVLFMSAPAFAQADFTGTWGARYQEDFPERIPGPELGDFLGLPINAAARQFGLSWDPTYLAMSFITSTNFKREADGSKWRPTACKG